MTLSMVMTFEMQHQSTIHERNGDKLDFMEMKMSFSVKDNLKRIRQATDSEEIFAKYKSDKRLVQNIQRTLKNHQ